MTERTMTKGGYAEYRGVSAGRISQYIHDGKIGPSALEGEGRAARIVVEIADRHLSQRLDPSQALGANGSPSRTAHDAPKADPGDPPTAPDGGSPDLPEPPSKFESPAEAALRVAAQEKAAQAQLLTAKMRRAEAMEVGRYMLAEDARAEISRAVTAAFQVMDTGLRDIAAALASQFELPSTEVSHALGKAFRAVRERAAADFRSQAEAMPAHVEDDADVEADAA